MGELRKLRKMNDSHHPGETTFNSNGECIYSECTQVENGNPKIVTNLLTDTRA